MSVSLSADGNSLAVGALFESSAAIGINGDQNDNTASESGAVYVFVLNGESWQQHAYVKANNTDSSDEFGFDVILSGDGRTLAVGAIGEHSATTGINGESGDNSARNAGAVYIY